MGNALALVGAFTVAVYILIGRPLRTGGTGVLPYSMVVCFSERPGAATVVGGVVVLSGLFLLLKGRRLPNKPVA